MECIQYHKYIAQAFTFRLDHHKDDRSVIACAFSGHMDSVEKHKLGGDLLVTVTSDDRHTVHIWRWMTQGNKYIKA